MNKVICFLIANFLLVNFSACVLVQEELTIVEDGNVRGSIVLGQSPSQVERFAARELQKYLQKMSGATVPITEGNASEASPAFVIGKQARTNDIDLSEDRLGSDGFVIKREGSNVMLVGREGRGTLFSVYSLLEKLGCRYFAPDFEYYKGNHELIPKKETIVVGDLDIVEKPRFAIRMIHALHIGRGRSGEPDDIGTIVDWMAKNRLNVMQTSLTFATEQGYQNSRAALKKRGLLYASGSHDDFRQALPVEKYGEAHPEWFARTEIRDLAFGAGAEEHSVPPTLKLLGCWP